jgi:hypothetical protein
MGDLDNEQTNDYETDSDSETKSIEHTSISVTDISKNTSISVTDISKNTSISVTDVSNNTSISVTDVSNNTQSKIDLSNNKILNDNFIDTILSQLSTSTTDISENFDNIQHLEKLTFKNVNDIIRQHYTYRENHSSTALDILAIYMKGQKILYAESKTLCEQKLNFLMLPAIFISSTCTVLSVVLSNNEWGKILVSGLNAFNAFLLAVISYMKLDAKAEAHKTSSYKYDKLQSECEFFSGKLLFFASKDDDIDKKIDEIEAKVKEIKETNQFILPEVIRNRYHDLYSTNVFAEVKKVQYDEMIKINQLKDIINECINLKNMPITDSSLISFIKNEKSKGKSSDDIILNSAKYKNSEYIKNRLIILEKRMNQKIEEIIEHRKEFLNLDDTFEKEIKKAKDNRRKKCCRFDFLKS